MGTLRDLGLVVRATREMHLIDCHGRIYPNASLRDLGIIIQPNAVTRKCKHMIKNAERTCGNKPEVSVPSMMLIDNCGWIHPNLSLRDLGIVVGESDGMVPSKFVIDSHGHVHPNASL